jgi:hypothetical protein
MAALSPPRWYKIREALIVSERIIKRVAPGDEHLVLEAVIAEKNSATNF